MKRIITNCISLSLLVILFSLDGCFLFPDNPKEAMPPATQTGANTMGFLLNGQLWVPSGYDSYPNLVPYYDPNFHGKPIFNITSYRVVSSSKTQGFALGINGIYQIGTYQVLKGTPALGSFSTIYPDSTSKCSCYWSDSTVFQKGTIVITKLMLPIISGTFDFVLHKPGCDSIKISNGRFDFKFQ